MEVCSLLSASLVATVIGPEKCSPVSTCPLHQWSSNSAIRIRCCHVKVWKPLKKSHRLRPILKFQQNLSHHVQVTCLRPDFYVGRWRRKRLPSQWPQLRTVLRIWMFCNNWIFLTRDRNILTFVSVTPLDIFKETSGQFPDIFVATETGILSQKWSFPHPNQVVLVPKP